MSALKNPVSNGINKLSYCAKSLSQIEEGLEYVTIWERKNYLEIAIGYVFKRFFILSDLKQNQ